MPIRCPNCGEYLLSEYAMPTAPLRPGCPSRIGGTPVRCCSNCGYPEEPTPREPFFRAYENERDMELYDDLFDAHAKLSERGGIDQP